VVAMSSTGVASAKLGVDCEDTITLTVRVFVSISI
jgi:hypothetical protein